MKAHCKEVLPQAGSGCSAVGESRTGPSPVCPSYSGGGTNTPTFPSVDARSQGGSRTSGAESPVFASTSASPVPKGRLWGSGSDSAASVAMMSDSSNSSPEREEVGRKRPRREGDRGSPSDSWKASAPKISTSVRGKGRGKTKVGGVPRKDVQTVTLLETSDSDSGPEREPSAAAGPDPNWRLKIAEVVSATFEKVALKKGKKATRDKFVDAATASITAVVASCLPPAAEMTELRSQVARVRAEMEVLRKENLRLKAGLAEVQRADPQESPKARQNTPPPVENQLLALVRQELAAFQQRFNVLESKILRPPLAASQEAASYAAVAAKQGPSGQTNRGAATAAAKAAKAAPATNAKAAPAKTGRKKGGAAPAAAGGPPPPPSPPPSATPAAATDWQVAGQNAKSAKGRRKKQRKERNLAARLRAPKTAAVVITLQPDAAKKGVTYGEVLAKARRAVDVDEFGVSGGLRLKITATGARLLEVPGAASGATADAIADRIRASLDADVARVSRPMKCADLRIMGLDDTVTEEDVVAAIVRASGCPAEQVRVGTIRPDATGLQAVTVGCPVSAAKKIAGGRRLLVGWVSAQVKLLEPRPLRCYRCQVGHHVGMACTSEVDRSGLCFRCGQPGHKAGSCTAASPHCYACAAAGKPADHRAGGKACVHPAKARRKGRTPAATATTTTAAVAATKAAAAANVAAANAAKPPQGAREGALMDCH